jgi:allantoin racemase
MLGGRIGVIVFGRRVLPMYQEVVAGYGLASRIAGWRAIESTAAYARGAHPELDAEIVAVAHDVIERDGAESIVLTGAVMAGVPRRLQPSIPVPVVDCIAAGIRQCELLAGMQLPKPRTGSYAMPAGRELVNVDAAILRAFARSTES